VGRIASLTSRFPIASIQTFAAFSFLRSTNRELIRHVRDGWSILSPELGEYIEIIPAMKHTGEGWYLGTADAVFQNTRGILTENADLVLILAGIHIYKMNYRSMVDWHGKHQADITIATTQAVPEQTERFGVAEIDLDHRVVGFEEKPQHGNPVRSIFNPSMVSASMGIYVFDTDVLARLVREDAESPASSHDFGKDIIPRRLRDYRAVAYNSLDITTWRPTRSDGQASVIQTGQNPGLNGSLVMQ
jgi:glucose-1-phosphate adenylyltransferase